MGGDYFSRSRPRLFGHRGAAGVAPENTLPSFRRAIADGVEYLELDVHGTRDGVVVVIHDPTLARTTDGSGAVRDLSFAELSHFDAGYRFESAGAHPFRALGVRVPALHELLDEFPDTALNIEIKQADPPIEPLVAALLREYGAAERVVLAAEDHAILERIRAAAPGVATSASYYEGREFFERWMAGSFDGYEPRARALQVPPRIGEIELATPESVAVAHRFGLEMHVWTINDPAEMKHLLDLGVDGVMSDFPAKLCEVAGRL